METDVKIEVGVMRDELTVWPAAYRSYASPKDTRRAIKHLLEIVLAQGEVVAGFRTTRVRL